VTAPDSVFITGGSGLVGGHLLRRLCRSGVSVTALVRSEASASKVLEVGGTPFHGDLFDVGRLTEAVSGADTVFHVAGVNDTCPRQAATMDHVNIDGTKALIAAAGAAGVPRVVYTSSAAAIGEAQGMIGTEATSHTGEYLSAYARSKHLAEQAAYAEAAECGLELVVVSPSSVQGPGRATGSAKLLLRVLNARRPMLFDTYVSIVDIEDSTAGHIAAAQRGEPGARYLLSSASIPVSDAVRIAADITGRDIRPRWLSERVVRRVGIPTSRIASLVHPGAGICPALVATLLHGHRFDGSKAERELGVVYHTISDTFSRTIDWFASRGLLVSH